MHSLSAIQRKLIVVSRRNRAGSTSLLADGPSALLRGAPGLHPAALSPLLTIRSTRCSMPSSRSCQLWFSSHPPSFKRSKRPSTNSRQRRLQSAVVGEPRAAAARRKRGRFPLADNGVSSALGRVSCPAVGVAGYSGRRPSAAAESTPREWATQSSSERGGNNPLGWRWRYCTCCWTTVIFLDSINFWRDSSVNPTCEGVQK